MGGIPDAAYCFIHSDPDIVKHKECKFLKWLSIFSYEQHKPTFIAPLNLCCKPIKMKF
jgi:hypothetical protein